MFLLLCCQSLAETLNDFRMMQHRRKMTIPGKLIFRSQGKADRSECLLQMMINFFANCHRAEKDRTESAAGFQLPLLTRIIGTWQ